MVVVVEQSAVFAVEQIAVFGLQLTPGDFIIDGKLLDGAQWYLLNRFIGCLKTLLIKLHYFQPEPHRKRVFLAIVPYGR